MGYAKKASLQHDATHWKGVSQMRKYHLFNKPAKVEDVLQDDLNTDISSNWQTKAERLQKRRWQKVRLHSQLFNHKTAPRRRESWSGGFGRMLET